MPRTIDDQDGPLPTEGAGLATLVADALGFSPLDVDRDGDAVIVDCTWEQADTFRGLAVGGSWELVADTRGRKDYRVTVPPAAVKGGADAIPGVARYVLVAVTTAEIRLVGEGY